MKIETIDVYPLVAKLDRPFGWSQRWTDVRSTNVVKVTADGGIAGWGESSGGLLIRAALEGLAPLLIGENPVHREALWQKLYRSVYQDHGFAGPGMCAISALDMALWDISGKAANVPVHDLLGGRVRDRIPVYATGLYYRDGDYPDAIVAEATGYAEQGFTGMKMKIGGKPIAEDIARVYTVRGAIGPDVRLMVDANEAYSASTAIRVAERLADADLSWFEEPCSSYDDDANLRVRESAPMAISGGEGLQSRYEFANRLARHVFDIVQPDIVNVGGVSEMVKVGHMANAFGVHFNPHFWGSGISLAATLHVCAMLPSNPPSICPEPYVNETVMELDQTPHPIRESLTEPVFDQVESYVAVPTAPGLGIAVDEQVLKRFLTGSPVTVSQR